MVTCSIEAAKKDFGAVLSLAIAGGAVAICDETGVQQALLVPTPQGRAPGEEGFVRPGPGLMPGPCWMAEDFNDTPEGFEEHMP